MVARILFLTLLIMNLTVAGWLLLGPQTPPPLPPPRNDPGVQPLALLSERDSVDNVSTGNLEAQAMAGDRCFSIGPFPTQVDLRRAMSVLGPRVRRIQFREQMTTQARGYQVYLPAMDSREQALAMARRLSEAGVRDYYVVTAGDQQNTVSLGLFREQNNAQRRQQSIQGLGFSPEILTRTERQPQYWIDYALGADQELQPQGLGSELADRENPSISCF